MSLHIGNPSSRSFAAPDPELLPTNRERERDRVGVGLGCRGLVERNRDCVRDFGLQSRGLFLECTPP